MNKLKIGISIGDINGIGPEVIIKALSDERIFNLFTPIIYGSSKAVGYHKNIVENTSFSFVSISSPEKAGIGQINVINCWQEAVQITLGKATTESGRCAYIALDRAVEDLRSGKIHALVTAPVQKHAMKLADFPNLGHTDFIAERIDERGSALMVMVADNLRIALVTTHLPISQVSEQITKKNVYQSIHRFYESLRIDFGIEKPTIAVLGLNPHAGDNSEIGSEDEEEIQPAIIEAKKKGILVSGPYSADGFFGSVTFRKFDGILAMYHDQGLIPFKVLSFNEGINFTAGLSVVRTSPDHGTAYDIAGKNEADELSFRNALFTALDISRSRKEFQDAIKMRSEDPLHKTELVSETN